MTNSYFTPTGNPGTRSPGSSLTMRNQFTDIAAAFDKVAPLSGNANKAVVINAGGTAQTVTTGTLALAGNFATTGAFALTLVVGAAVSVTMPVVSGLTLATLTGTETLTNKTISGAANTLSNIANASLTNSSITINGSAVSLGGSTTVTAVASSIVVGTTTVGSGTTTRVLYNNAGTLGEYAISGTGSVAMTTSPTFVTPTLGVAIGTSLALGGATIGSNALAVTGTSLFSGTITLNPGNAVNAQANVLALQSGGTSYLIVGAGAAGFAQVRSDGGFSFSSNTTITTAADANFSRISAGIIGVGTGAAASIAGGMQMATLAIGGATIGSNALAVTGTANLSSTLTVGGVILASDGSSSAPSHSFSGATNLGFYRSSNDIIQTSGGTAQLRLGQAFVVQRSIGYFAWSSTTDPTASVDTLFSRMSAGIVGVGTGVGTPIAGGLQAGTLALGGATIGSNALAVTGTALFNGDINMSSTNAILSLGTADSPNNVSIRYTTASNSLTYYVNRNGSGSDHIFRNGTDEQMRIRNLGGSAYAIATTSATPYVWTSGVPSGTIDTGLSRVSAGVVGVGTGAAGSIAGGLQVATVAIAGATIGSNALAVTGNVNVNGGITTNGSITMNSGAGFIAASYDINQAAAGAIRTVGYYALGATLGGDVSIYRIGAAHIGIGTGAASGAGAITAGAATFSGALTYGGVTLSNSVTGTGSMVLSASPTFTGTVNAAAVTLSGALSAASVTGTMVATQADQETATSTTTVVSPGRQQYHPSALKAWGRVSYSGGTPTLDAGYNVASLTDNGTGDYSANYTTAFSIANYAAVFRLVAPGLGTDDGYIYSTATGSVRVQVVLSNANSDSPSSFMCAGDQ